MAAEPPFCVPACATIFGAEDCTTLEAHPSVLTGNAGIFATLYSGGYALVSSIPSLVAGVGTTVQDELTKLFFRVALVQAVPYFIVLIVLIIVLMRGNVVSTDVGIMLIMFTIVMTVIGVGFILFYTQDVVENVYNDIVNGITTNFALQKDIILEHFTIAWAIPDHVICPPTTSFSETLSNALFGPTSMLALAQSLDPIAKTTVHEESFPAVAREIPNNDPRNRLLKFAEK